MDYSFHTINVDLNKDQPIMTVTLLPHPATRTEGIGRHWELGELFSRVRGDDSIRIIVVQGTGDVFQVPPVDQDSPSVFTKEEAAWHTFTGVIRCHEAMADLEKPIVAKVNGDAIGFGSSLAFACDLIVATKNARFADHHLSMGDLPGVNRDWGVVPGDGGLALMPLILSRCLANEYLMLGRSFLATEFERLGVINYAVEKDELDATTNRLVGDLLRRGTYSLAWTKRLGSRIIAEQMRKVLDSSAAYELVDFYQIMNRGTSHDANT